VNNSNTAEYLGHQTSESWYAERGASD